MKKWKTWFTDRLLFRSEENDKHAGGHRPPVTHPRHVSRRQTCDDQLSIRAGRQQRGNKARFPIVSVLAYRTLGQRPGRPNTDCLLHCRNPLELGWTRRSSSRSMVRPIATL